MISIRVAAALLGSFGLTATLSATPQHAHEHHAEPTTSAVAAPAQRWTPDASLRSGIRRAHTAVDQLKHYEMGHMSAPMAVDRAGDVVEAVNFMFAHCELASAPDAALHGILAPLLVAAQALKNDPKQLAAVADMRAAIAHYPQYFNDPGWDVPAPVMHEMHDEP